MSKPEDKWFRITTHLPRKNSLRMLGLLDVAFVKYLGYSEVAST